MGDYFHTDIDNFEFKVEPTSFGTGDGSDDLYNALTQNGAESALWTKYINSKSAKHPLPHSFEEFVTEWRNYTKVDTNINETPPLDAAIETAALTEFTSEFESILNMGTDFADLSLSPTDVENLFKGAFSFFLKRFPYKEIEAASGGLPLSSEDFFGDWKDFLTVTAVLMTASATGGRENLPSFEKIFETYFPGEDFTGKLTEFYARFVEGKGYFIPSHHVDDWTSELRAEWERTKAVRLSPDEKRRRGVMILVFKILRRILERLQETVQVQAAHLSFLAEYQAEYTELMGRVPLYQANPPRLVGSSVHWEDVIDDAHLDTYAEAQIESGLGALNEPNLWESKGFAGITLREIREEGLLIPTFFGYTDSQIAAASALADMGLGDRLPEGNESIPSDHIFYSLKGEEIPGVWWLVEQPYDGSGKYGGSPKGDSDLRTDVNQVRQQWIEQLRSKRNIIKDQAKQAQTDMSQTQEAINQQSNLMTSIIQQLSGILQAIFR